jgi:hypothetical protein
MVIRVFDRSNPIHRARLQEIMATVGPLAPDQGVGDAVTGGWFGVSAVAVLCTGCLPSAIAPDSLSTIADPSCQYKAFFRK